MYLYSVVLVLALSLICIYIICVCDLLYLDWDVFFKGTKLIHVYISSPGFSMICCVYLLYHY